MTKEEIFERLQTEVIIRGLSHGTYVTYKRAMELFFNWTDKPYEELEEIDFRNYLLYLINRGDLSTATINMYNVAIRLFMQVILEKDVNYRRTARLRKEYKIPPVWSMEEVTQFFEVIDNIRDRAIFINIYGSGLRISEICTLKVQDVDSKNMRLKIRQSKGKKDRYTILSQSGLHALRAYWKRFKWRDYADGRKEKIMTLSAIPDCFAQDGAVWIKVAVWWMRLTVRNTPAV